MSITRKKTKRKEKVYEKVDEEVIKPNLEKQISVVHFTKNTTCFLGFTPVFKESQTIEPKDEEGVNFETSKVYSYRKEPKAGKPYSYPDSSLLLEERTLGDKVGERGDYIWR